MAVVTSSLSDLTYLSEQEPRLLCSCGHRLSETVSSQHLAMNAELRVSLKLRCDICEQQTFAHSLLSMEVIQVSFLLLDILHQTYKDLRTTAYQRYQDEYGTAPHQTLSNSFEDEPAPPPHPYRDKPVGRTSEALSDRWDCIIWD